MNVIVPYDAYTALPKSDRALLRRLIYAPDQQAFALPMGLRGDALGHQWTFEHVPSHVMAVRGIQR